MRLTRNPWSNKQIEFYNKILVLSRSNGSFLQQKIANSTIGMMINPLIKYLWVSCIFETTEWACLGSAISIFYLS